MIKKFEQQYLAYWPKVKRIAVIALSRHEFLREMNFMIPKPDFTDRNQCIVRSGDREYFLANDLRSIRGAKIHDVIFAGQYWRLNDLKEIENEIRSRIAITKIDLKQAPNDK